MVSKRERAEKWPSDIELLLAHRAQARGILGLLQNDMWKAPTTDKVRHVGNYMLLSSFITPEPIDKTSRIPRVETEKLTYITGMIAVGFRIPAAINNAESVYATNLRKLIYPLFHIPDGSPELIETRRNGKIVGRALDIEVLCDQAHLLAEPTDAS